MVAGAVLLAALGAAVYANSLAVPFLFDDRPAILNNPHVRRLWPIDAAVGAPARSVLTGRPVASLSFALNHAAGGLDPRGYHAVNVGLHVLSAVVLLGLVRRMLGTPPLAPKFGAARGSLALAVAAIWLVHPLQTEAVTYVTQRTELLMGLFVLLTVYCALRDWTVASILGCALAVGSKETAVAAPLLVVVHDRLFRFASLRDAWRARRALYLGLAASWCLLAVSLAALPRHESIGFGHGISALEYARTQLEVVTDYLRLALWPASLCVDHGVWIAERLLPGALVVGAVIALTLSGLRRRLPAGFAGAWLLLLLAPTSSVVPITTEVMAERRMYLPLAAVVAVVVCGGYRIVGSIVTRARVRHAMNAALVGVVVTILATLAVRRNRDYASEIGLWRDVLAKRPENARAHNNLASLLLHAGDLDGAGAELTAAVRLRPDYAEAYYNLGVIRLARGQLDEAAGEFRVALAHDPRLVEAHYNLGTIHLQQGRYGDAVAEYEETLRLDPSHANARTNLGVAQRALTDARR